MAYYDNKLSVEDLDVADKRVLVRVDFNVPLDSSQNVTDDTRIREALPTIKYLADKKAKVILVSHLGRPKGQVSDKFRMAPAANKLEEVMGKPVKKVTDVIGPEAKKASSELKAGEVLMLDNVRFHKEEEKNDEGFAKELASMADLYVNDAFGTAHRAHASTAGVTKFLKQSAAGYLIAKEIKFLSMALANPERPFTAILGGAKVSSKITVLKNLADKVDNLLIGGGMAYTFLRAMDMDVGKSLVEEDHVKDAKEILKALIDANVKWLLPFEHVVTDKIAPDAVPQIVTREGMGDRMAVDIGPGTVEMFGNVLAKSRTIFWNGPMGVFETVQFSGGTFQIALWIAACQATTIVGGGDSVAAINKLGIKQKFSHVSTGGGASMEFIEGRELPGIAALSSK